MEIKLQQCSHWSQSKITLVTENGSHFLKKIDKITWFERFHSSYRVSHLGPLVLTVTVFPFRLWPQSCLCIDTRFYLTDFTPKWWIVTLHMLAFESNRRTSPGLLPSGRINDAGQNRHLWLYLSTTSLWPLRNAICRIQQENRELNAEVNGFWNFFSCMVAKTESVNLLFGEMYLQQKPSLMACLMKMADFHNHTYWPNTYYFTRVAGKTV